MKKQTKKDDEAFAYYVVKPTYRVRTKKQADELIKHFNSEFGKLVDKWCAKEPKESLKFAKNLHNEVQLPKDFGK
jgi:hypothetical protein